MDIHKDFTLPPRKFWVSLGFGHHMGPDKIPLSGCYTIIETTTADGAHRLMFEKRGNKWSHIYESAEMCGVDRFNLHFIPFDKLLPQHGDTL
jgi:hypothetical protein